MDTLKPWDTTWADRFGTWLPIVAAVSGFGAGILGLANQVGCAVALGSVAMLASAAGVLAAGRASKLRDDQIRFWINATSELHASSGGFGS